MGTIKLKRGTGSPAGSLEQYEVAMDVAAQTLYVSSNGTDAVILANKYDDADAVSAVEAASTLDLTGTVTVEGGLTNDAGSYGETFFAKRDDQATATVDITIANLERDIGSEVINSGFDAHGVSLDYILKSDAGAVTQYLGGISMQSGSDDGSQGHWLKGWSYTDGQSTFTRDSIFHANKDDFYVYGNLRSLAELIVSNIAEFNDTVTVNGRIEANDEIRLHDTASMLSMDAADSFSVYDTPANFTATNFGNTLQIVREEQTTGVRRQVSSILTNFVDSSRNLVNPGNGAGMALGLGVNNSEFAQLSAILETTAVTGSNTIDYVNSESRIQFTIWTGDPTGTGSIAPTTAFMIEPHINQVTMNSIDGGVTNFGTDGDGLGFQANELSFNVEDVANTMPFKIDSNNKMVVEDTEVDFEVPIGHAALASDPASPSNGWTYYNTTTHKLRLYANGAWVDLN